jgi:hypothetical protein
MFSGLQVHSKHELGQKSKALNFFFNFSADLWQSIDEKYLLISMLFLKFLKIWLKMSKNLKKLQVQKKLKGCKKSLEGQMRPAGRTLAMSVI